MRIASRFHRLIVTLISKKYFFTFLLIFIWWHKVCPEGWFEILAFVGAVLGLDIYQKKVGISYEPSRNPTKISERGDEECG